MGASLTIRRLSPPLELLTAASLLASASLFVLAKEAYERHYDWARLSEVAAMLVGLGHFGAGLGWLVSRRWRAFLVVATSRLIILPLLYLAFVALLGGCDIDQVEPCADHTTYALSMLASFLLLGILASVGSWLVLSQDWRRSRP